MSLNLTASTRFKKRPSATSTRNNPLSKLHRKSKASSISSSLRTRKPSSTSSASSSPAPQSIFSLSSTTHLSTSSWPFPASSSSSSPASTRHPHDVSTAITYIQANQFTPLPASLTGLGLHRDTICEILNFRKFLPSVILIHHIYSVLPSATAAEREIAGLVANGTLRRVNLGGGGIDGIITTDDFITTIAQSTSLDEQVKDALLQLLDEEPGITTITDRDDSDNKNHTGMRQNSSTIRDQNKAGSTYKSLPRETIMSLLSAGFLTINNSSISTTTTNGTASNSYIHPHIDTVDITKLTPTSALKSITSLPPPKDHSHLSTLASLSSISDNKTPSTTTTTSETLYTITPPRLGLLKNLHSSSKSRLLDILRKCPHREATMAYLKEKWDGGVSKNSNPHRSRVSKNATSVAGNGVNVKFEGRARKWRDFKGLTVEWVVGGLMGAGVVDGFEAVGVGRGVRLV